MYTQVHKNMIVLKIWFFAVPVVVVLSHSKWTSFQLRDFFIVKIYFKELQKYL